MSRMNAEPRSEHHRAPKPTAFFPWGMPVPAHPFEPTMNIQLASDLHLELLAERFPATRLIAPAPEADLLVLAGDIHNGIAAVAAFADWPVPVLYVAGNHEFYDQHWQATREALRHACVGSRILFLDNDRVELGGVRFLGCTLWTECQREGFTHAQCLHEVERMRSGHADRSTGGGGLRVQDTLADHQRSRRWLAQELAQPHTGPTVVITHHGPHPRSVHPRYAGDLRSTEFVSDLTPLLCQADLWLHGHVHDSFDYADVGRCRVVANPAGYVRNRSEAETPADFQFENPGFNQALVLEVEA